MSYPTLDTRTIVGPWVHQLTCILYHSSYVILAFHFFNQYWKVTFASYICVDQ